MHEIVRMENICSEHTLRHVKFNMFQGEIVGLLGLNNSGKTELMKILSGFLKHKKGTIYIDENRADLLSPLHANRLGIFYITNKETLLPNFSVAENIFVLQPRHARGFLSAKKIYSQCDSLLEEIKTIVPDIGLTSDAITAKLSELQKLVVLIMKAINNDAKVIVIDHFLYEFPLCWVEKLAILLNYWAQVKGTAFVLTDCRPNTLSIVCKRIFILREGANAGCFETNMYDDETLTSIMTWHWKEVIRSNENVLPSDKKLLEFVGVELPYERNELSFDVCANETVGLCSLSSNFSDSLSDVFFGQKHIVKGKILLEGKETKFTYSNNAIRQDIGVVSDQNGVFTNLDLQDNVSLMALKKFSSKQGIINKSATMFSVSESLSSWRNPYIVDQVSHIDKFLEKQIVICRSMAIVPKMMIYINLDRGLDRVSYNRIIRKINEAPNKPTASLFVTSNIHNLLSICTKIYFVKDGKAVKKITQSQNYYEEAVSYYKEFCEI